MKPFLLKDKLTTSKKAKKHRLLQIVIGISVIAGIPIFSTEFSSSRPLSPTISPSPIRSVSPTTSVRKPGCNIKGNISITTGNKLYHLPGMEDYESTIIDPTKGERWFCTEQEAIANGWRKAPR